MLRFSLTRLCNSKAAAQALNVSQKAWDRIRFINKLESHQKQLRLSVGSGGCKGYTYKFEFADDYDPDEDLVINEGAEAVGAEKPEEEKPYATPRKFLIDKESVTKLQGATIDYHIELKGGAFVVVGNELVDESCACGSSFSVRKPAK